MKNTDISNLIYGVAVGDAMGFPVQFYKREQVKSFNLTGMIPHKCGKFPAGTWSDDTSLTLALADSLSQTEEIDYSDIMKKFYNWISKGAYTPAGKAFDMGRTCFKALLNYSSGLEPLLCGGQGENENGNGSLMRISPLVFYIQKKFGDSAFENKETFEVIHNVSSLTHAHPISLIGCDIYCAILVEILNGTKKEDLQGYALPKIGKYIRQHQEYESALKKYDRIFHKSFKDIRENEIRSSGYVVDSLEAALWCFLTTESYRDCILKAVNLGKDTDSIAAVSGAMAGLYYKNSEEKRVPKEWKCALQNKKLIESIIKKLSIKYDSDYALHHVMLYLYAEGNMFWIYNKKTESTKIKNTKTEFDIRDGLSLVQRTVLYAILSLSKSLRYEDVMLYKKGIPFYEIKKEVKKNNFSTYSDEELKNVIKSLTEFKYPLLSINTNQEICITRVFDKMFEGQAGVDYCSDFILSSLFPNMLCNGGYNYPGHDINDVFLAITAFIQNRNITDNELHKILKDNSDKDIKILIEAFVNHRINVLGRFNREKYDLYQKVIGILENGSEKQKRKLGEHLSIEEYKNLQKKLMSDFGNIDKTVIEEQKLLLEKDALSYRET